MILVVVAGIYRDGWGQTSSANVSDHAHESAQQTSFHEPNAGQNAIRIVAKDKSSLATNAITTRQPSTEVAKVSVKPPLATTDYENFNRGLDVSVAEGLSALSSATPQYVSQVPVRTFPKRLKPVTPVTLSNANLPANEPAPRDIAFGGPIKPAAPKSAIEQPHSPASLDASSNWLLAPVRAPRVAMQQEAPATTQPPPLSPLPPPPVTEQKAESPPSHTEVVPPVDTSGGPLPIMTSSNYLPANPEAYCFRCGVKCPPCGCNPGGPGWAATRPIPWEVFAQGEYVGPARLAHVPVYRLRVDDRLAFVYRLSGQVSGQPYRLNVRDRILVQSLSAPEVINREVIVEPDGTITLPLLGQVRAAGATLSELSRQLDEQFKRQIKDPRITVTPIIMNSNLEELRSSVDRRYGQGGQVSDGRVSPDGTIQLPAIGSVPAQGLTLDELEREIKSRYSLLVNGLEVTPILTERAPRFVYVVGEVRIPGRFAMEGPTTVMQAIALAGSWNVGAQLNEVVVFRRDENWQLMATKVNVRSSLLFKKPCPEGEIWLRDSDIVLVPKSPILCADDVIELVFTRGIYGVFPMTASLNFTKLTSL